MMIVVENLVARYGEREVLKGISLEVEEGQIMVVMGQSGCGKTTFLRHLIGLQKPASGRVLIGGHDVSKMRDEQYREFCRSIGVLFQSGALFNSLTVKDNVAFPLREHTTLSEPVIDIIVKMKLDQVDLSGADELMPAELSGGMRKRAGLARALALDPHTLMLDEPTSGLDPIIAAGVDELILSLRETYGVTMVVVAHDIASGLKIADTVAIFADGAILQQGTAEEMRNSDHPYVRQFLERRADEEAKGWGFIEGLRRAQKHKRQDAARP